MPKIDFDTDSAPFSGGRLPSIEDVASIEGGQGDVVIEPKPRSGSGSAWGWAGGMIIGLSIFAVFSLVPLFTFWGGERGDEANSDTEISETGDTGNVGDRKNTGVPTFSWTEIPTGEGSDIRIVEKVPSKEGLETAWRLAEAGKNVLYFTAGQVGPEWVEARPGMFYIVQESQLPTAGVLIDGYRWYSLGLEK